MDRPEQGTADAPAQQTGPHVEGVQLALARSRPVSRGAARTAAGPAGDLPRTLSSFTTAFPR
ncbi:hypothetical protein, partial [Streptomyces sp. S5]|uniref:hypothetical protein n=1 Tax=Streptomyces sp. S5 TaxID=1456735 RepID=UPI001F098E56